MENDEFGFDSQPTQPTKSDEFGFDAPNVATLPTSGDYEGGFNPLGAALTIGGGAVGSVAGGYRGMWDLLTGKSASQAAQDVQATQEKFTPEPGKRTTEVLESLYNPLNWAGLVAKKAGEVAQEQGASPGVAAGIETAVNAIPAIAGVRSIRQGLTAEKPSVNPVAAINDALQGSGKTITDLSEPLRTEALQAAQKGPLRPDILKAQADADGITKLTEGQATGDPMQFAKEKELAKRAGKETPPPGSQSYAQTFERQRQDLLNFMDDKLGAGSGVTPESSGQAAVTKIAQIDKTMSDAITDAYNKVRDSQGRSAKLNPEDFYTKAETALERDNASAFLPKEIANIYDEYTSGKIPLTVDSMTSFDKILSRAARTTQDGNAQHAINLVRSALNDTSISGEAGTQAAADYAAARGMARQRFELSDPKSQRYIPGYDAVMKAMGNSSHADFLGALEGGTANIAPAKWFKSNITDATPAGAKKLMQLFETAGAQNEIGLIRQGLVRGIRDNVVKGNPMVGERQELSGDALSNLLKNKSATLSQVLTPDDMANLNRLSTTSTKVQRAPAGAPVNYSNTAAALDFMEQLPNQLGRKAATAAGGVLAGPAGAATVEGGFRLGDLLKGRKEARMARAQAEQDVNPPLALPEKQSRLGAVSKRGAEALTLSQFLGNRDE